MRKSVAWHRDPAILARLHEVERRHLEGQTNTEIAAALGVDEITIRRDIDRLAERWRQRIDAQADELRARTVQELEDVRLRSLAAARWDEACERAVLFGEAHPKLGSVYRDDKGSASFRGNKQGALNVARQSVMDKAKVLGIIVEKNEHLTPLPVRIYEVDVADGRSDGATPG